MMVGQTLQSGRALSFPATSVPAISELQTLYVWRWCSLSRQLQDFSTANLSLLDCEVQFYPDYNKTYEGFCEARRSRQ